MDLTAKKMKLVAEDVPLDHPRREEFLKSIASGGDFIVAQLPAGSYSKGDTFSLKVE